MPKILFNSGIIVRLLIIGCSIHFIYELFDQLLYPNLFNSISLLRQFLFTFTYKPKYAFLPKKSSMSCLASVRAFFKGAPLCPIIIPFCESGVLGRRSIFVLGRAAASGERENEDKAKGISFS